MSDRLQPAALAALARRRGELAYEKQAMGLIRGAGSLLARGAHFAASVPEGEKFFSSIPKGIFRAGKVGLFPNIGKYLNPLRIPVTGYSAISVNNAYKDWQDANKTVSQGARNALEPTRDVRTAAKLINPSANIPDVDQSVWNKAKGQTALLRDSLHSTAQGGILGALGFYNDHRQQYDPKVRSAMDATISEGKHDLAQNVGYSLRDTPWWHQAALSVTSPAQWALRKAFLPRAPASVSYEDRAFDAMGKLTPFVDQKARNAFDYAKQYYQAGRAENPLTQRTELIQEMARRNNLPATTDEVRAYRYPDLPEQTPGY